MIYIQKGKEPASLTAYKKQAHAYYDGCNKDDIRENLLREQGYLCAYCMRRIEKEKMKIQIWSYKKLNAELKNMCNFESWNKYLEMIGQVGEKFVYSIEVQKLLNAGKEKLAELVDPSVALDHRNGFDMLSFTESGKNLYIEYIVFIMLGKKTLHTK